MKVKVKFILWLKDRIGREYVELELNNRQARVIDILREIAERYPFIRKYLPKPIGDNERISVLLNGVSLGNSYNARVGDGDEIVLAPLVSGG